MRVDSWQCPVGKLQFPVCALGTGLEDTISLGKVFLLREQVVLLFLAFGGDVHHKCFSANAMGTGQAAIICWQAAQCGGLRGAITPAACSRPVLGTRGRSRSHLGQTSFIGARGVAERFYKMLAHNLQKATAKNVARQRNSSVAFTRLLLFSSRHHRRKNVRTRPPPM